MGRSPGGGHGNPLQYSCLKNPHGQEEPGGLQSMGSQRVGHGRAIKHTAQHGHFHCASGSVMSDSANPWTIAHQAPLSLGFSRQEYWGGCHALLQGIFPTQVSCTAGGFFIVSATGEAISESPGSHHINPIPTYCRCFHSQRFDIFWFGRLLVELLLLSHLVISDSL